MHHRMSLCFIFTVVFISLKVKIVVSLRDAFNYEHIDDILHSENRKVECI